MEEAGLHTYMNVYMQLINQYIYIYTYVYFLKSQLLGNITEKGRVTRAIAV